MKKAFILFVCLLNVVWASAQFSGSGSGTKSDPYLIFNPIQLNQVRGFLCQDVYFKLMADVDLTEWIADNDPMSGWQPIGTSSEPFCGTFDGNGKKITGLKINRSSEKTIGFFSCVEWATIKDVAFSGNISASGSAGCVVGISKHSTFSNITYNGNIKGASDKIGGISGIDQYGKFNNCEFNGKIEGGNSLGGITGSSTGSTFNTCLTYGNIIGVSSIGGISGYCYSYSDYGCSIMNCGSLMNIDSNGDHIGGIIGEVKSGGSGDVLKINQSFASQDISSKGNEIGGIIGYVDFQSSSSINCSNSYYIGNIIGKQYVGGIIGRTYGTSYGKNLCTVDKCYSSGIISGDQYVGGIIGYIHGGVVTSSVSVHSEINAALSDAGRIYGKLSKGIIGTTGASTGNLGMTVCRVMCNGVQQTITSGEQHGTNTGRSTLNVRGTYQAIGWDFNNDWNILDTECIPFLKGQMAPPFIENGCLSGSTEINGKSIDGGTIYLTTNGETYSTTVSSNQWAIKTNPLQGGLLIAAYADSEDLLPSYKVTQEITYLGKGTELDPYQICTAADLANAYGNYCYKLMNDIDLTAYIQKNSPNSGWAPIGKGRFVYASFDGDGHTISGLWTNTTEDYVGLFSNLSNASVKNLNVMIASGKKVKGGNYTGAIAGHSYKGIIENCIVKGDVSGLDYTGGIVGFSEMSINVQNNVIGNVVGSNYVGGIVGKKTGDILKSQFEGNVSSLTASAIVGGIAGASENASVQMCLSMGTIKATGISAVAGGLIGANDENSSLKNSYSSAEVTSNSYVGGVVGYNYGSVENCYASGNLSCQKNFGGGIVGYNDGSKSTTKHCVAINTKIEIVDENGWASRIVGGLKNGAPTPDMDNYANKEMIISINGVPMKLYDDNLNGTSVQPTTLSQMATYETFGWDFTDIWVINDDNDYPQLQWVKNIHQNDDEDDIPSGDNPGEGILDTDYSKMSNAVYIKPEKTSIGSLIKLPINLKNANSFAGFQFDLYIPEGVSVCLDEYDDPLFEKASRINTKTSLEAAVQSDGAVRFLCYSTKNYEISGSDGEILNVTLKVSDKMKDGDYAIYLKNVILNTTSAEKVTTDDMKSTLTISSFTPGDVDEDGSIDVVDIGCVASYILGSTPVVFNSLAADFDADGSIDVVDIGCIANFILNGSAHVKFEWKNMKKEGTASLSIPSFAISAGEVRNIDVVLENNCEINGCQFDLLLPKGLHIVMNGTEPMVSGKRAQTIKTESSLQENGSVRILSYSTKNECYTGQLGAIVSVMVKADDDFLEGEYEIGLRNIILSKFNGSNISKICINELNSTFTSIDGLEYNNTNDKVYNLNGWQMSSPQKGINIINNKKYFIK